MCDRKFCLWELGGFIVIDKIKIKNLTVFEDLEIDTSAPINVFIGENGTGKTQILKLIHSSIPFFYKGSHNEYREKAQSYGLLIDTIRDRNLDSSIHVILENGTEFPYTLTRHENKVNELRSFLSIENLAIATELREKLVFIPAKDMLTHSKGLSAMKEKYGPNMPFDQHYYIDIISKAFRWKIAETPTIAKNIIPLLEDIMDGVVEIHDEVFFIKKRDGKTVSFDYEAEGIKKIGLLWQLLMNESITEGTILLWDEPESNLNPKLSSIIADMLLELSRNGVKIFLTTHNYFLAKYFDLLEKDKKEVIFHSLYRADNNLDNPVLCETSDTFSMLNRNNIIDEIVELFETEMEWE